MDADRSVCRLVKGIYCVGSEIQRKSESLLCHRIISAAFSATDEAMGFLSFCHIGMDIERRSDLIEFCIFYLDAVDI